MKFYWKDEETKKIILSSFLCCFQCFDGDCINELTAKAKTKRILRGKSCIPFI